MICMCVQARRHPVHVDMFASCRRAGPAGRPQAGNRGGGLKDAASISTASRIPYLQHATGRPHAGSRGGAPGPENAAGAPRFTPRAPPARTARTNARMQAHSRTRARTHTHTPCRRGGRRAGPGGSGRCRRSCARGGWVGGGLTRINGLG